jgi:hypothetical protein
MADEWDSYIVKDQPQTDEWSQYEVKPITQPLAQIANEGVGSILGGAVGVGAAAGAGYGLLKTGIPQNMGRAIGSIGSGVANMPKVFNITKGANFAQEIRGAYTQAHTEAVNKFGIELDTLAKNSPKARVDLSEVIMNLKTDPDVSSKTLSTLKKIPEIAKIWDSPTAAAKVPLKNTQNIINYIQTKVPREIKASNYDLMDTLNNIRGKQLDAFPELSGARAEYAKFIEPYKNVKQYFKFNRILGAMRDKFGGAEGMKAVESILPKSAIKKIGGYRAAAKMAEIPGDIPLIGKFFKSMGGALGVAPMIAQAISFSDQLEKAKKAGAFSIGVNGEIVPLSKEDLAA